jgi:hypothetical protein
MLDNNLNLSICRVKVNCQIRKFKITKLKHQVMPTWVLSYLPIDSTDGKTVKCTFPFVLLSLLTADINFKFKRLGFCNTYFIDNNRSQLLE